MWDRIWPFFPSMGMALGQTTPVWPFRSQQQLEARRIWSQPVGDYTVMGRVKLGTNSVLWYSPSVNACVGVHVHLRVILYSWISEKETVPGERNFSVGCSLLASVQSGEMFIPVWPVTREPGEGRAMSKQMLRYFLEPSDSCWKSSKETYTGITGKMQAGNIHTHKIVLVCILFLF